MKIEVEVDVLTTILLERKIAVEELASIKSEALINKIDREQNRDNLIAQLDGWETRARDAERCIDDMRSRLDGAEMRRTDLAHEVNRNWAMVDKLITLLENIYKSDTGPDLSPLEKALADGDRKIAAIKIYRARTNEGLTVSKNKIEAYIA